MAEWYKDITRLGHAVIRKTRLSNAMGVPLVFVCVVTVPCILVFMVSNFWPLLVIAVIPVLYFTRAFDYIMKNNPNLLRTEEHEEKMLQISAGLGQKNEEIPETKIDELPSTTDDSVIGITTKRKKN